MKYGIDFTTDSCENKEDPVFELIREYLKALDAHNMAKVYYLRRKMRELVAVSNGSG